MTVIKRDKDYISPKGKKYTQWLCSCDCGEVKTFLGNHLKNGNTQSCGCLHKEMSSELRKNSKKQNIYDLSGEYGIGYTFKNEEFYFDLEDYSLIKNFCWCKDKDGYILTVKNKTTIKMHRLIMNCPDDMDIDHIYHINYDNRKNELRTVTVSQNGMNRKIGSNNTSGVKGVYWNKRNKKWYAQIRVNNIRIHLGYFINKKDAIKTRKEAETKYFGEYNIKLK